MKYQSGRITASRLHQVVHTDPHKPALSLIYSICYPETRNFFAAATKYGCEHEKEAVKSYEAMMKTKHQNLEIRPAGLVLYLKRSCFAASPDSFIECTCCGKGILEVKCPFCLQDVSIKEIAQSSPTFCLAADSSGILLPMPAALL